MKKLMLILTLAFAVVASQTVFAQDKPVETKVTKKEMKVSHASKTHKKSAKKMHKAKKEMPAEKEETAK